MPTWREDTIQALKNLGGVAHLSEIHKEVEKLRKGKLNNTWTQTVQRELETYSSDSEAFGGGKDIFYMAEGKGKGVWGLRNLNAERRRENATSVTFLAKTKTTIQFLAFGGYLISLSFNNAFIGFLADIFLMTALILTIQTGLAYTVSTFQNPKK